MNVGIVPKITAIVCTRNRVESLCNALNAMISQALEGVEFDLIVVDNGSTDNTKQVVENFQSRASFPISYYFEPIVGLSQARNRGLEHATGDILAFTDDDCYVSPHWSAAIAEVFKSQNNCMVGGRVELFNESHIPMTIKTDLGRQCLSDTSMLFSFLHGANMVFDRAVFDKVGFFDTRFGAGSSLKSAEDTDYVYRSFSAGVAVTYEPTIVVYHDHGRTTEDEAGALWRNYNVGFGAMATKHILRGRTEFLKALYWNVRSEMVKSPGALYALRSKGRLVEGALRYLTGL